MTTALEGGEWSAARPGRTLPLGKTRCPLYKRLGGPQGRSGRAENLVPTRIRSRTVYINIYMSMLALYAAEAWTLWAEDRKHRDPARYNRCQVAVDKH